MPDVWPRECRACPGRLLLDAADALWHVGVTHQALYTALMAGLIACAVVKDPRIEAMSIGELWERERRRQRAGADIDG